MKARVDLMIELTKVGIESTEFETTGPKSFHLFPKCLPSSGNKKLVYN